MYFNSSESPDPGTIAVSFVKSVVVLLRYLISGQSNPIYIGLIHFGYDIHFP